MSSSHRYSIPAAQTRTEMRVSNSRFIATAAYTPSVDDAKALIARMRTEFADAAHNVFAYSIGYGATTTLGMSDDGEPAGTAGRPALAVLRGSGLGDVTVVVTRYFGGTLLGTGGLVRAYGDAVRAVLDILPRTLRIQRRTVLLSLPYAQYQPITRLIAQHDGAIEHEEFGVDVTLTLRFAVDDLPQFAAKLGDLTAGQAELIDV
jgi:uncharacterized YigZ family protein